MPAIGGSIEELTIDGRTFAIAADADSGRKLGGMENDVQQNGNGTARVIQTRVGWSLDGLSVSIDDSNGDDEYIQNICDAGDLVPVAITYASGIVYQGTGQVVGETPTSSQSTTKSLALMGSGKLTPQ